MEVEECHERQNSEKQSECEIAVEDFEAVNEDLPKQQILDEVDQQNLQNK